MNVFMYIWCVALLRNSRNGMAKQAHSFTIFPSHVITQSSCLTIQTLICHHSHSNFILCARFTFSERLYFSIFFFLLLRSRCLLILFHRRKIYPSIFGFMRFIFLLRWSTIIIKCHSSPSSCCPLCIFFYLFQLRFLCMCLYTIV